MKSQDNANEPNQAQAGCVVNSIAATLQERGSRYGEFDEHARITQNIKRAMQDCKKWQYLRDDMKECLEMLAHKIGRILNGDPMYKDSWHDIVGYAKLVDDSLLDYVGQESGMVPSETSPINESKAKRSVQEQSPRPMHGSMPQPALMLQAIQEHWEIKIGYRKDGKQTGRSTVVRRAENSEADQGAVLWRLVTALAEGHDVFFRDNRNVPL